MGTSTTPGAGPKAWTKVPWLSEQFYPAVFPTAPEDRRDHVQTNVHRYLGQLVPALTALVIGSST